MDVFDTVGRSSPELEPIMHIGPQPGSKHGSIDGSMLVEQISDAVVRALVYLYPNGDFKDWSKRHEVGETLRSIAVKNFTWKKIRSDLLRDQYSVTLTII